MDNKRKDNREPVFSNAEILVDGNRHSCRMLNISTGGAKLQLARQLDCGKAVVLSLGNFGQFNAQIVWQQGGAMGVKFSHDPVEMAAVIMGLASYG
jgi:hypothetical protein